MIGKMINEYTVPDFPIQERKKLVVFLLPEGELTKGSEYQLATLGFDNRSSKGGFYDQLLSKEHQPLFIPDNIYWTFSSAQFQVEPKGNDIQGIEGDRVIAGRLSAKAVRQIEKSEGFMDSWYNYEKCLLKASPEICREKKQNL